MRVLILLAGLGYACAQAPDPAYEPMTRAYESLRNREYDAAVSDFLRAAEISPRLVSIRKDLGYTYLKVGENIRAREQFQIAMELDPNDLQVAKEYAFLCYETGERRQARRVFDRVRKTGDGAAEQAFQNIDAPLAAGIERWSQAIAGGAENFSAHYELAKLAEERDALALAAEHYEKAWRLSPERRSVLVDLGRVWKDLGRGGEATAALLAASRGGETRAAESAREMLPDRYPYVPEFRRALDLDPDNAGLRRELAYLLLEMDFEDEAIAEFRRLTGTEPGDLLSATQLGFLLNARGDAEGAQPLFDKVLAGHDLELANRVRAVLHLPQVDASGDAAAPTAVDAREMAERSIKAGYLKDALKYLQMAHQADPFDAAVMLKIGWTFNMLREDKDAIQWFGLARNSPDSRIAREAGQAWQNLRRGGARFRTSYWMAPVLSTRWRDLFSYSQIKTEYRSSLPVYPYVSLRFIGDERRTVRDPFSASPPQQLSESSFIPGLGLRTASLYGVTAWAEAGLAAGYLSGHFLPDFRGGVSTLRRLSRSAGPEAGGWFGETGLDAVFVSRFGNDVLVYERGKAGYSAKAGSLWSEFYWNGNVTGDNKREDWANFWETGPGLRFAGWRFPRSSSISIDAVRGGYLIGGRAPYFDLRVGFWYAATR